MRIALVAGEASGDLLGAGLITELRNRFPDAQFAGIGGDGMRAAGLGRVARRQRTCGDGPGRSAAPPAAPAAPAARRCASACWPGSPTCSSASTRRISTLAWNSWLKQRGVRTVHYVSPSVWAWREKRAAKIGRSADRVLCLFPMEPPIYARHGVDARFVGHPLADDMPLDPDRAAARARARPGRRRARCWRCCRARALGEIERLGTDFLAAAARVLRRNAATAGRRADGERAGPRCLPARVRRIRRRRAVAGAAACSTATRTHADDRQRRGAAGLGHGHARSDARKAADGRRLPVSRH